MSDDPIENLLRSTASETRTAIRDADFGNVPPFKPNNNRAGAAAAGIVLLLIVGLGGWLLGSRPGDESNLEVAVPTEIEDGEPTEEPSLDPLPDEEGGEVETATPEIPPVTDLQVREQQELEAPAIGESFVDPAFGTTIVAATDAASGEQIVPVQSPAAVWNADESLLLLYQTGGDVSRHIFVDASTFEIVGELPVVPSDIEDVFWHPTDPDLVVTTTGVDLVTVSASTGNVTTIASHPQCDSIDPGVGTAGPSWDGSLIALRCLSEGPLELLSQPLAGGPAASLPIEDGEQGMASPDGQSIILEVDGGFEIYDTDLSERRSQILWEASAPTVGVDGDGNPVIVSAGFQADFPAVFAIAPIDGVGDEGAVEVIVGPDTGFPAPRSGTRTSASSWNALGVFAAASPLPVEVLEGGPFETFDGEVVVADLSTSPPTVRRVAHTRNTGQGPFGGAFVSISPSGRFVAFASDFGDDSSNTYIIDLESGG